MTYYPDMVLPTTISYGAQCRPRWKVIDAPTGNGGADKVVRWQDAAYTWDIGFLNKTRAYMVDLLHFFHGARASAHAFNVVDPLDNNSSSTPDQYNTGDFQTLSAADQLLGLGDGATADWQLIKNYATYGESWARPIKAAYDVVLAISGISDSTASDQGLGVWRFPTASASITAATQANPCVVTVDSASGFSAGGSLHVSGVAGMTALNGNRYAITGKSGNDLTLDLDSSGFTAYTSGGTVATLPQASEPVTAGYRFYVPARFVSNEFPYSYDNPDATNVGGLVIESVKL